MAFLGFPGWREEREGPTGESRESAWHPPTHTHTQPPSPSSQRPGENLGLETTKYKTLNKGSKSLVRQESSPEHWTQGRASQGILGEAVLGHWSGWELLVVLGKASAGHWLFWGQLGQIDKASPSHWP